MTIEDVKRAFEGLKTFPSELIEDLCGEDGFVRVGETVVLANLVRKAELNGVAGKIENYDLERGRFVVLLEDGSRFNVKEDNFAIKDPKREARRQEVQRAEQERTPLQRAYKLFSEGAFFEGVIRIPGFDQGGEPSPYKLEVINRGFRDQLMPDEFEVDMPPVIFAIHTAFDDSQVCDVHLSVNPESGAVEIRFADRETSCKGIVNTEDLSVSGTVSQLIHASNGFTHPADEVTHRFTLKLNADLVHPMARMYRARSRIAFQKLMFEVMKLGQETEPNFPPMDRLLFLAGPPMQKLMTLSYFLAEEACAILRNWAAFLGELRFESPSQKLLRMRDLADKYNISRRAAHSLTDRGLAAMHQIIRIATILDLERIHGALGQQIRGFERIQGSFSQFESAITAASARIPLSALSEWEHKLVGETCIICLCETDAEESSLVLPCGHCFHRPCAERWLHMNSTCPCCRRALTGEEGRTNPSNINTDVPAQVPESSDGASGTSS